MNTWKTFNFKKDYKQLDKTVDIKLFNGKVVSIWNVVGGTPLDKKGEEINIEDIGWYRTKKDYNRFNKLQKHYETLEKYDFEVLDDFEFAIYDTYAEQEDKDKIAKLFEKLKKHIEIAQQQILTESKLFL